MGITKIEVSQINGKRQNALQHPDGIAPVYREIGEEEERTEGAAFPEAERDHALTGAFGSNPLNEKAHAKNDAPA
jgi:hypothetical protein